MGTSEQPGTGCKGQLRCLQHPSPSLQGSLASPTPSDPRKEPRALTGTGGSHHKPLSLTGQGAAVSQTHQWLGGSYSALRLIPSRARPRAGRHPGAEVQQKGGEVSVTPRWCHGDPRTQQAPMAQQEQGGQQAPMVHGDPGARRAPTAWQEQGLSRMGGSVNPNGARGCRSSASPEGMSGAGVQQDRRLSKPPWCTGTQRLGEAQRHSSMGGLSDPRCCMGPSEPTSTAGQGSCGRLEEGGALQGAAQLERKRKAAERHRG